jgi:hypothetical protein
MFMVETRLVCSPQNTVSFYQTLYLERLNFLRTELLLTDVQQHVSCSPLMDEWDNVVPLIVHPFQPRGKSPTVGIESEECSAPTESLHSKGHTLKMKSIRDY